MNQQTTMDIYRDIVLECQHCYAVCRYAEASRRRTCPSCGLAITNWDALTERVREKRRQAQGSSKT
jgi:hypothetical protein